MRSSTALGKQSQTDREFHDPGRAQPRQILSPFKARRIKRAIVSKYCRGEIPETAVTRIFDLFWELRDA
jgi:hypothetical protein